MIDDLLQTKLHLPILRSPFLVPRPRLFEQLDAYSSCSRLTLVSAPAGFGKTTLIAGWIRTRREAQGAGRGNDTAFAWLSLDEADNDPVLFWSYVLAALARAGVPAAKQLLALLSAPSSPPISAVITHLLNDLQIYEGRIALVLDDYHLIDAAAIHEQISFLLQRLPPQLHLVLLTRADPPLPLPRFPAGARGARCAKCARLICALSGRRRSSC